MHPIEISRIYNISIMGLFFDYFIAQLQPTKESKALFATHDIEFSKNKDQLLTHL